MRFNDQESKPESFLKIGGGLFHIEEGIDFVVNSILRELGGSNDKNPYYALDIPVLATFISNCWLSMHQ